MKYLFALLFILTLCTGVRAQANLQYKPSSADSARWQVVQRTASGDTVNISYSPYDTLPQVIAFGQTLYREGGFVGSTPVTTSDALYTDEVLAFYGIGDGVANYYRDDVANELLSIGNGQHNVMKYDTITNRDLVGNWVVTGESCGMSGFISSITIEQDANGWFLQHSNDGQSNPVDNIAPGVISVFGTYFFRPVVVIKDTDSIMRAPFGCKWTKQQ